MTYIPKDLSDEIEGLKKLETSAQREEEGG